MAAATHARRQPSKKPPADTVRINLTGTRYQVVRAAAAELGIVSGDTDCNVFWIDGAVPLEKYLELRSYQKINHFPGMGEISRKDALARNVQRMKRENRGEYHFFPATWVLPADHGALVHHMTSLRRRKQRKTFIIKPHNSSMGNGIYLTRSPDAINPSERAIIQEYIEKPFLLDGFKCDLRVYVLVTSCNPLRVFAFKDGLVRLSTEQYTPPNDKNLEQYYMHLTNYSVNRHSASFDPDEREDRGSKRTLCYLFSWLRANGHNVAELWAKMHDVIVKTLILAHPHLLHSYSVSRHGQFPDGKSQFFEILGFDILLDHTLQPWVLEVNRSPSFGTDAELDLHIKTAVIRDALRLANVSSSDKYTEVVTQRQASRRRLTHSKSYTTGHSRMAYDFQAEQDDAAAKMERRRVAARERLSQLRKERELEAFEEENKGGYVRVHPSSDYIKAKLYSRLMEHSLSISAVATSRSGSVQSSRPGCLSGGRGRPWRGRGSGCGQGVVQEMDEHELLDLLSQCEDSESGATPPWHSALSRRPSTTSFQSLALQDSVVGNMLQVMTARLHEEEQTQRTMVALQEMAPFYPGKTQIQVHSTLEKIREEFLVHRANIGSFWMGRLDNAKRKQLLAPVSEAVTCLLHSHWRRANLSSIHLHRISSSLMAFLLERRGEGLWSSITTSSPTTDKKSSWEALFKKKHGETLSVAEMECCRRIVDLSQSLLYCAYYYHCLLPRSKHKPRTADIHKPTTLPHLKRHLSLTTPTTPRPPPPSSHRSLTVINRSDTPGIRRKPSITTTTTLMRV